MAPIWKKLGHVYSPKGDKYWMKSHASNTVPMEIDKGIYRVYFSSRDNEGRSHISYIDMDLTSGKPEIIMEADSPVLSPGNPGFFDESGVSLSCIVKNKDRVLIYYLGWTLGKTVPWYNSIGVAELSDCGKFGEKLFKAPIYSRSEADPISLSYPFLADIGGETLVYYGSNRAWGETTFEMDHVLKVAKTTTGLDVIPMDKVAIEPREGEYAFSRPFVFANDNGGWSMYYSFRGDVYKIGYAESLDGVNWERLDDIAGIMPSESGWDSEMICYPCLFEYDSRKYMTYNGNGYGKTGFGLAVEEN